MRSYREPPSGPNSGIFECVAWAHTKIVLQGYPFCREMAEPQVVVFPADEYQR
ncbi:MAG: hypothetical protein IPO36_24120 [Anaerolineales bacterium]|nr:hypothetical protein [Anaerolineales bacterium]